MATVSMFIQHRSVSASLAIRREKEIEGTQIRKEEVTLLLIVEDTTIYRNFQKFHHKTIRSNH